MPKSYIYIIDINEGTLKTFTSNSPDDYISAPSVTATRVSGVLAGDGDSISYSVPTGKKIVKCGTSATDLQDVPATLNNTSAVYVQLEAAPIEINLTKEVTTLTTENKYIPSNIDLIPQTEEKTITENGTFTPTEGKLGFSKVTVNIPTTTWTFQEKEQTITTNGTTTISKDASSDGMSKVTVTSNITWETEAKGPYTPSEEVQEVTPSEGIILNSVLVQPIPANYVTTTDATVAASKMLKGKTAYVNGVKVTGTIETYAGELVA